LNTSMTTDLTPLSACSPLKTGTAAFFRDCRSERRYIMS
jgi:hypothetical protein